MTLLFEVFINWVAGDVIAHRFGLRLPLEAFTSGIGREINPVKGGRLDTIYFGHRTPFIDKAQPAIINCEERIESKYLRCDRYVLVHIKYRKEEEDYSYLKRLFIRPQGFFFTSKPYQLFKVYATIGKATILDEFCGEPIYCSIGSFELSKISCIRLCGLNTPPHQSQP